MWWNPIFISTVTKSSLGSISWATVLRCVKYNVACQNYQQTRDVDPMLVQFWPTIYDAGPASNQHWFNALCLLGFGSGSGYCWRQLQADTDPMSVKCWVSIAVVGQYPFSPSQYFMLAVPACWLYRHDALNQSWGDVGPQSVMLAHIQRGAKHDTVTKYWANVGSTS